MTDTCVISFQNVIVPFAVLLLFIIMLVLLILNTIKLNRLQRKYKRFMGGSGEMSIEEVLSKCISRIEKHELIHMNTKRNIENIVATSFELYLINQARYVDLVQHRESSFEVYESYQKEFDLGTRSLFDLLNAQIEFYNARVGETQGVFDIYTDIYRLLASTGELVNYFGSPCCCE